MRGRDLPEPPYRAWVRTTHTTTCCQDQTYTLYTLPWTKGVARFASDLFVDEEPHMFCPRQNFKRVLANVAEAGYVFNVGIEPEHFLVTRNQDGSISVWDPNNVDTLAKPCYDFKGIANVMDYLRDMMDGMRRHRLGRLPVGP